MMKLFSQLSTDISIHALLAESDAVITTYPSWQSYFYPRSPCGERRRPRSGWKDGAQFLSTLSLRRATPYQRKIDQKSRSISIHALLAESDSTSFNLMIHHKNFYPRSPCGERPLGLPATSLAHREFLSTLSLRRATLTPKSTTGQTLIFLSTLSLRRATNAIIHLSTPTSHFYPRSPCGERLGQPFTHYIANNISIHALLAESDKSSFCGAVRLFIFLSTLSLRRATILLRHSANCNCQFLSTLSLRRATSSLPRSLT